MPRKRIPKPHPPDTDTLIFREKLSWISPKHVEQFLRPDLDEAKVIEWIENAGFPIPFILLVKPEQPEAERFYRSDFILALFGLEGKFCLYCLKPLGRRQYQCCSRTCVSRYDQWDEHTVNINLPVSGHVALKLFRCALIKGMVPQGLGGVLLKDRVEVYHMRFGEDVLIKEPKFWDERKIKTKEPV